MSLLFDENFNLSRITEHFSDQNPPPTTVVETDDQDLVINRSQNSLARGYVDFVESNKVLKLQRKSIVGIVKTDSDILALIFDFAAIRTSLYKLIEKPRVSKNLQGLWVNDALKNQGLSLSVGKRRDGSEYVFASLHVFKDGQPFWLAGSQDLMLAHRISSH